MNDKLLSVTIRYSTFTVEFNCSANRVTIIPQIGTPCQVDIDQFLPLIRQAIQEREP